MHVRSCFCREKWTANSGKVADCQLVQPVSQSLLDMSHLCKRLNLSRRKKGSLASSVARKSTALEVYKRDVLLPSGISNPSNNCYSSCIIQCLFNLPSFPEIARELFLTHKECNSCCCTISKMQWFLTLKSVYMYNGLYCVTGPVCSVGAVRQMSSEYQYSPSTTKITPYPLLAALPGKYHAHTKLSESDIHTIMYISK